MKHLFFFLAFCISLLSLADAPQEGYATYSDISMMSAPQKAHFQIYRQIKTMRINGTYRLEKCFTPKYKPFIAFVTTLQPKVATEAQNQLAKANQLLNDGNDRAADIAQQKANLCKKLNTLCLNAQKLSENIYAHGKLDDLMAQYTVLEIELRNQGLKLPKRDWLTPLEAQRAMDRLAIQKR